MATLAIPLATASGAATVHVVLGSDTSSVFNTAGANVVDAYENEFDMTPMSEGVFPAIFDASFRNAHIDSHGNPFVFTWFMLGGGWHHPASNVDAVAATRVFQDSWQSEIDQWGDEIAYHFHNFTWNGTQWVMAPTFEETEWDFEWTLSQMVFDTGVLPVSFRSGWNWMSTPYQQALERWIPFRLEGGSWMSQDVPYHPSATNYRQPGAMRGWEVRHRYLASLTQGTIDQIFDWAEAGQDQVTCLWSHQYESTFPQQISDADAFLHAASATHPSVEFLYLTSRDAMRLWQGSSDVTPPPLTVTLASGALVIESAPDIFQINQPFVAARQISDEHIRLDATPTGSGRWEVNPFPADIDRVGVAVCDLMGNVAMVREVRDGSHRWSSQTEFARAESQGIDALTREGQVTLERSVFQSVLEQTQSDGATATLQRSYWIGQTFIPSQPGLSRVEFGAKVTGGSATIRVELREVGSDGFPIMADAGFLASAEATAATTGWVSAELTHTGLVLDGRQYALVFKRVAGTAEIRMHRTGSYAGGNLVRAYSLDWIHIPAFDCQFQTFDQGGVADQGQATQDADTYVLESARFLSQTFVADMANIDRVEVMVAATDADETFGVQLRRTLAGGQPDLSHTGLIAQTAVPISASGLIQIEPRWEIPTPDQGSSLALTFVSPASGRSAIALASQSGNPLAAGALHLTDDTSTTATTDDLWFRLSTVGHTTSGELTWDFDSEADSAWTRVSWEADSAPPDTRIRARFAFADDQAGLDAAAWGGWVESSPAWIPAPARGRWIRVQASLNTLDGSTTPILRALEVEYEGVTERAGFVLRGN